MRRSKRKGKRNGKSKKQPKVGRNSVSFHIDKYKDFVSQLKEKETERKLYQQLGENNG